MEYAYEINKNELTEIIFNKFVMNDVLDEFDIDDITFAKELDERPVFLEGVVNHLSKLDIEVQVGDTDKILKEVRQLYKDRIGERCPKAIEGWIKGTEPSAKERENNYSLCYALKMSLEETAQFFLKYFLTAPFNYKDRIDAVYFYCLYNNKSYDVIKNMLEISSDFEEKVCSTTATMQIYKDILEINDDDIFLKYLKEHCYSKEQQYQFAKRKIIDYMKKLDMDSITDLHIYLMGFNYLSIMRENQKRKKENKQLKWKKNTELPKRFYESLPTEGELKKIVSGEEKSYESLRKILIILMLFDYYGEDFSEEELDEEEIKSCWEDFYVTVNDQLLECGFAPLYVRHPFDWLILYCANSTEPVELFRDLSAKRFVR